MKSEETFMGLQPLFSKWVSIREQNKKDGNEYTEENVKKFLFALGFTEVASEVMSLLAQLTIKSARGEKLKMNMEYEKEAKKEGISDEAVRTKLTYYIEKNYEQVKKTVFEKTKLNIGDRFGGNKNFIKAMGVLYVVCRDDILKNNVSV